VGRTDQLKVRAALVVHNFTVDVEEYFQVSALSAVSPPASWAARPSRVVASTLAVAGLLAEPGRAARCSCWAGVDGIRDW
jgi:hypothetical protein